MPDIIKFCDKHWPFTGWAVTRDIRWDGQEGHGVVAEVKSALGIIDRVDCHDCRWASDPTPGQIEEYPELAPTVEQALGTVRDPTRRAVTAEQASVSAGHAQIEKPKARMAKKEVVTMTKTPKVSEPKPRERKRKPIGTMWFGGVGVECRLVNPTPENFLSQTEEQAKAMRDFLQEVRPETPKGA